MPTWRACRRCRPAGGRCAGRGEARDRELAAYVADRRVEIAETIARAQAADHELQALDDQRTDLLLQISRRETERARQEAERLRMQAQIQAEEAAQARRKRRPRPRPARRPKMP
jgi:hypothetical protein